MGIGGLDEEFSGIFRRAFASRVFPPDLIEKLGIQHVKGAISQTTICLSEPMLILMLKVSCYMVLLGRAKHSWPDKLAKC